MKQNTQNIRLYRLLIVLLLSVSTILNSWSQITVVPNLASRASQKATVKKSALRTQQRTLTLPFFEDFASSKKTDTIWQKNVGVYINNSLGIDPPTLNVASFDGVDNKGIPYDLSSSTIQGAADTLVSCPIDLSALTAGNNVYLSFFWQAQGLGEFPDTDDSLQLQFKDVSGTWVSMWAQQGGDSIKALPKDYTKEFKQEILQVADAKYFHDAFQFRFIAYARLSGSYDTWNLDDVFLDQNRNASSTGRNDIVVSQPPNSILKRYNAMPLNQYFANAANETAATITTKAFNLNTTGFSLFNYDCVMEETLSNTFIGTLTDLPVGAIFNAGTSQDMTANVAPSLLDGFKNSKGVTLRYRFRSFLNVGNRNDIDQNDTISRVTVMTDYYAYDDGSAEFLAGINQNRGQVAYRYVTNEPDTLTDVHMYVARLNKDLSGQTMIFKIWKNKNGKPDSVLFQKIIAVSNIYAPGVNQFVSIKEALEKVADRFTPLVIKDTVFVGWQQTSDDMITVGLDKNTDSSGEIFSNLSNEWVQNTEPLGSLMIRPVFGTITTTGITRSRLDPKLIKIFPNPNQQQILHIEGLSLKQIQLLNLQGQVMKVIPLKRNFSKKYQLDLRQTPPGTYLLYCRDWENRSVAKRVVILK